MEQWKQYKIGDLCSISSSKRIFAKEYQTSGIPFYRGKEVIEKQKGENVSTELYISEARYNEIKNKFGVPEEGDMLLTSVGTLGVPYVVKDETFYFKDGNLTWFGNFKGLNSKFLYYWFLSPMAKNAIDAKAIGSTQKALTIDALSKFEIDIPNVDVQNRIVSILSSLDNKIELNRRINDNLEQQVQALFKAWFVDFEPFKDGEFVDSELGMIPKAWKIKPLEYLVEKVKSGDWGKDEPTGNYTKKTFCMRGADFPYIKEGNKGKMPIRYILEKNFNDKSLCDGNVVVEISGGSPTQSTGRIVLVDRAFVADCGNALICTNFCKSLEIKEDYSMFFYLLWQYLYDLRVMFIYENGSNGLKNLNVNSLIERESFVIPTKEVVSKFNSVVSDLLSTKQANGIEVSRLASLRDTLLPKLMSGELKNSEIETEK